MGNKFPSMKYRMNLKGMCEINCKFYRLEHLMKAWNWHPYNRTGNSHAFHKNAYDSENNSLGTYTFVILKILRLNFIHKIIKHSSLELSQIGGSKKRWQGTIKCLRAQKRKTLYVWLKQPSPGTRHNLYIAKHICIVLRINAKQRAYETHHDQLLSPTTTTWLQYNFTCQSRDNRPI